MNKVDGSDGRSSGAKHIQDHFCCCWHSACSQGSTSQEHSELRNLWEYREGEENCSHYLKVLSCLGGSRIVISSSELHVLVVLSSCQKLAEYIFAHFNFISCLFSYLRIYNDKVLLLLFDDAWGNVNHLGCDGVGRDSGPQRLIKLSDGEHGWVLIHDRASPRWFNWSLHHHDWGAPGEVWGWSCHVSVASCPCHLRRCCKEAAGWLRRLRRKIGRQSFDSWWTSFLDIAYLILSWNEFSCVALRHPTWQLNFGKSRHRWAGCRWWLNVSDSW